jgi:inosine/xanthosine triphosphatase
MAGKELRIIIASRNPAKVNAAQEGFCQMFPDLAANFLGIKVLSDVRAQPMSDEETLNGAHNRVENVRLVHPEAHFWIGIEGGVQLIRGELTAFAWVVVRSQTLTGKARSGAFFLPRAISDLVEQGIELGMADDMVFGVRNSKEGSGAVGLLTHQALDRKSLYRQAVLLALIPFRNEQLYRENKNT